MMDAACIAAIVAIGPLAASMPWLAEPLRAADRRVVVEETRDRDYLSRWMLRPSIVRKISGGDYNADFIADEFDAVLKSGARFFAVHVNGEGKGCIIFRPVDGRWEMHFCLSTWFTDTRKAVRAAMDAVGPNKVFVRYEGHRRAVTILLDDLGFDPGVQSGEWCIRNSTSTNY
jgi:hypothetical protein